MHNIEGFLNWDIVQPVRNPGISAMVRLKDEEQWMIPALDSIEFCDEVVIILHGKQNDNTASIARTWSGGRATVYEYPFECHPNGPGHDDQPKNSVYERAYFYNWCLSKTTREYVLKWDGDMLADARLKDNLEGDLVRLTGMDVTRHGLKRIEEKCPRYFRVTPETYYLTGSHSEQFSKMGGELVEKPMFMHFKWMKSEESITKAWPTNWRQIDHFKQMWDASA